jgi:hypothetical protein
MVIIKDKKGLINIRRLTSEEKSVFVIFLEMEKQRHLEDIENIENTIAFIRVKR